MASPLLGRRIVLGITGSIAAYKAAELLRRLRQQGAEVQVVMTAAAKHFITEETLRTLSGKPVLGDMFAAPQHWKVEHVAAADWAELVIIAPATANTLAKLAHGAADELLCCLALSTRAPLLIAPAMDEGMFQHAATQANLARLAELGYCVMETEAGFLASGKEGQGRLASLEKIVAETERLLSPQDFAGLKVLITAGPTREAIDAVRFISNRSSGKMGYALAEAARRRGAKVMLVSGPTALPAPFGVKVLAVESADQMHKASLQEAKKAEIFIGAAAVGDFTPAQISAGKLKRDKAIPLRLNPTQDTIAAVAALGQKRPKVVVGFAAESEDLIKQAKRKLVRKGLDLIVANDISQREGGFGSDFNQASLIFADGTVRAGERLAKSDLADEILNTIKMLLAQKRRKR